MAKTDVVKDKLKELAMVEGTPTTDGEVVTGEVVNKETTGDEVPTPPALGIANTAIDDFKASLVEGTDPMEAIQKLIADLQQVVSSGSEVSDQGTPDEQLPLNVPPINSVL